MRISNVIQIFQCFLTKFWGRGGRQKSREPNCLGGGGASPVPHGRKPGYFLTISQFMKYRFVIQLPYWTEPHTEKKRLNIRDVGRFPQISTLVDCYLQPKRKPEHFRKLIIRCHFTPTIKLN